MPPDKITKRFFNNFEINRKKGIITKSSIFYEKMNDEIRWYLNFPKKFSRYLPRIYDYSLGISPNLTMKFYRGGPISAHLCKDNLSLSQWKIFFEKIKLMLYDFHSFSSEYDRKKHEKSIKEMYYDKTIKRLDELLNQKDWKSLFSRDITINGINYSMKKFKRDLRNCFTSYIKFLPERNFCLIHGDLCANNILFNPKNSEIKLIDPRGRFGNYSIYGDPKYDLAKLSHSFMGFYELILDGRYKISFRNNSIKYRIFASKKQISVSRLFKKLFLNDTNAKEIRLIESMLFLSMIPLHAENFNNQLVFLSRGLELFYHNRG
ncbi:MAG: phosphotransferase [Candidatus Woesearchaeota archaeon]|nr:phosphotransferase [Candidatus Woesearchaeota archaeon]